MEIGGRTDTPVCPVCKEVEESQAGMPDLQFENPGQRKLKANVEF
jgi:hypothetical protein